MRTPLADFFSILLEEFQKVSARTALEGVPREATERGALGHLPPAQGGLGAQHEGIPLFRGSAEFSVLSAESQDKEGKHPAPWGSSEL